MYSGKQLGAAIAEAIKIKGVSQKDVAEYFGVKPPSVNEWIKQGTIGKDKIDKLMAYFAENVDYDHWGFNGDLIIGSVQKLESKRNPYLIRKYDVIGAMGTGALLRDQAGVINEWRVTREWTQQNVKGATSVANLKIVTGFGDSMVGMFNSGDPLIVDTGVTTVEFDGVYFFRVGDEGFIKRLQRIPGVGLRAISENKAYEAWNITEGMDFEVFGRVLKVRQGSNY